MRLRLLVPVAALCSSFVVPAHALLAQSDGEWHVSLTPYVWLAGLNGRLGIADGIADIDLSAGDVFDKRDITVRALLEAHRDRLWVRLDVSYISMSDEKGVDEASGSDVIFEHDQTVLQPEVGYTVYEMERGGGIELLAGGRYWHPKLDVTSSAATGSVNIASGSRSWFDAVVGARLRVSPADRWHLSAGGDVGAGGSKLTWQATGTAGFDLSTCCSLVGAYRHLDIDYDRDQLIYDTYMSGFALGLEIRF
jgi:hypothetical protein